MVSVTQRIKQIKQPRGGYIPPKNFQKIEMINSEELDKEENIHASLIGLSVDYLSRFINGSMVAEAFEISLRGASLLGLDELRKAEKLAGNILGLDENSIISACKLVGYDVVFRVGKIGYKPVEYIIPDRNTINNIRIMVERSIKFFSEYGPIISDGFTFEGGYTGLIDSGDGDFLTEDTLWDFKVSKSNITTAHTLQLMIYYLMGTHSIHDEFNSINKIGVFNPRLNIVYILDISKISEALIFEIETEVIGY